MALSKPLVLARGATQQLQPGDDLDIPLAERVDALEEKLTNLIYFLNANGIEIPEEALTD